MTRHAAAFGRLLTAVSPVLTLFGALGLICWSGDAGAQDRDGYYKLRMKMVEEQIVREGIKNEAVLKAMREVPRHLFVDPKLRPNAYFDQVLPIGYKQTISPPYIVAYETETIDPQPTDKVLEIGTGSGYQAAVLSRIVKEVYTIEIVEALSKQATERLKDLGYKNIFTRFGDGYKGWKEHAPFDKILVTCSPEDVPQPLVDQLREGGRMIIPLGERWHQAFYLFEKRDGKLVRTKLLPTLFVPMTGLAESNRKKFPDSAHPHLINGGFENSTDGIVDNWYYVRQATLEHKGAREGKTFITFTNHDPGRDAQALQAVGIDGQKVRSIKLSLWVKGEDLVPAEEGWSRPALMVHFFDAENRPVKGLLGEQFIGPWVGTFSWKKVSADMRVAKEAHSALIRVGLNGATGRLSVDDVSLTSRPR
jgi:protein-L-isoaspartate(D-aspartate) O-methyltransferase